MTLEQFILSDMQRTGKQALTMHDLYELSLRWRAYKAEQAAPLKSDPEIDALLGLTPAAPQEQP